MKVLKANDYPSNFIRRCDAKRKSTNDKGEDKTSQESSSSFVFIAICKRYILKNHQNFRTRKCKSRIYRNLLIPSATCFPKPKDKLQTWGTKGVVYKINCLDCNFVYIGQTSRSLRTRIEEHRRAVNNQDKNSKIAQHVNKQDHNMDFDNTTFIDKAANYHKRLYLEAWYSQKNSNAGNDHIDIPDIYI